MKEIILTQSKSLHNASPLAVSESLSLAKSKGTHQAPSVSPKNLAVNLTLNLPKGQQRGLSTYQMPFQGQQISRLPRPHHNNYLKTNYKLPPKCRILIELNSIRVTPQSDSKALTNVDTYSCNNNSVFNFRFPTFWPLKIANIIIQVWLQTSQLSFIFA